MPVPPIPPPLEHLGQRSFSFYPPILYIEHNEWVYRRATWSEILVANTKTGEEIWVPRNYIGEVSRVDEPVMILGLTKELEYAMGQVLPHVRRVIEMPKAVNEGFRAPAPAPPNEITEKASVVGIRTESGAESRIGKMIGVTLIVGILGTALIVSFFRGGRDGSRVVFNPVVQSELGLEPNDDYFAVVRRLGEPSEDRWRTEEGEMQYRVLAYPDKGVWIILMGSERNKATYIGALNRDWKPVDSVSLPGGRNTQSMLRALPKF